MNTRQQILQLLNEGKTVDQIQKLLKGVKVANLRAYIHRCKRDLGNYKGKQRVKEKLRKVGIKSRDTISLKCKFCKTVMDIKTRNLDMYTKEVKDNWYCGICPKSIEVYKLKKMKKEKENES